MPKNTKGSTTKKTTANKKKTTKTVTKKVQEKKIVTAKKTVKPVIKEKVEAKKPTIEKKAEVKKPVVEKKVEVKEVSNVMKGESKFDELKNNTPFVVTLCVCVVLFAVLIFALCGKKVPKTSDGKEIIASISGKNITADELYEKLKEENGTDILLDIIDSYISDKEVKFTDEDNEYVDEVVEYYKSYAEYYGVDFKTFLSNYVGIPGVATEEEFKNYVTNDYKKTLAVVKFIGDNAKEEDLKEYYNKNYSEKLTVKHILIEVNDDTTDSQALTLAKKVISELDKTSASNLDTKFKKLAEDYSDDTGTYSNSGLMENFTIKDVVSEFWNASIALKDGEYTKEPVKTTYGYHVILKVSSKDAEKYEDVKETIKKEYAKELISNDNTLATKEWDNLRKQYKLSINDDFIKENYESVIKKSTEKTEE